MTRPEDIYITSAPWELQGVIPEFWPESEYNNAARIAYLESGFNPFALNDSTTQYVPCGTYLRSQGGVRITAERSVGYYQINSCNFPEIEWQRFYNARFNAEKAASLWEQAGRSWKPWYFSAQRLDLI